MAAMALNSNPRILYYEAALVVVHRKIIVQNRAADVLNF